MFAIIAAILFAIALLLELADRTTGVGVSVFVIAGLLGLALHMAGFSARVSTPRQWGSRSRWGRRRV
ncbi:hypothetical protein VMT65_02090 [Nocardia sp. CDC153]|uniref:hypothetical protein n=1 Tax=Nocardia sp. CDC153 TaxID=3112167 RepID=UPI002DBBE329|nr:hypothetical protein [Nocardia sp. CDC153]MEC3951815.1 hypothetical protein [Nocardia sp. CDC153]